MVLLLFDGDLILMMGFGLLLGLYRNWFGLMSFGLLMLLYLV